PCLGAGGCFQTCSWNAACSMVSYYMISATFWLDRVGGKAPVRTFRQEVDLSVDSGEHYKPRCTELARRRSAYNLEKCEHKGKWWAETGSDDFDHALPAVQILVKPRNREALLLENGADVRVL